MGGGSGGSKVNINRAYFLRTGTFSDLDDHLSYETKMKRKKKFHDEFYYLYSKREFVALKGLFCLNDHCLVVSV
jgi:hypothetical protein